MKIYTADDVLRIAKRFHNTRRNYLLVNPLQGKHLPTSPTAALEMMDTLGKQVAEKISGARLVIGFAETATAIGAVVAKNLSDSTSNAHALRMDAATELESSTCCGANAGSNVTFAGDCVYLQTTREKFSGKFVDFLEEHSHAPEQKLFAENFSELLKNTGGVVFVDDELSTGKTLLNIVRQLKSKFPALAEKKICAASIINRLSEENLATLADENIFCTYLVNLPQTPFDVEKFSITDAQPITPAKNTDYQTENLEALSDPRRGVAIGEYFSQCAAAGNFVVELLKREKISGKVVVLGTEEFMLPAIIAGRCLEAENFSVVTHSTTRSPIGISRNENYPIREGFKLRSFYDATRTTFIYNLQHYDAAVIMTNAQNFSSGLDDLLAALNVHGVGKIFLVRC